MIRIREKKILLLLQGEKVFWQYIIVMA